MAAHDSFWGDLGEEVVQTPVSIMREQAALLGQQTKNLVKARVVTRVSPIDAPGQFIHSFNLVVPTLDNYTYELFGVSHPVDLYPVKTPPPTLAGRLLATASGQQCELKTEDEFVSWLRERLSSPETKKIIGNLLAQVPR